MVVTRTDGFFSHRGVEVKLCGVNKNYRTVAEKIHALTDINWQVESGQAHAIMGPSGCGKTTLLNLIGGVDRPTSGEVSVDGQDLSSATERAMEDYRLRQVGFVFQFLNLIPSMTAFENLEMPMIVLGISQANRRARIEALLDMVGLAQKGNKRPEELSGGEQQRVAVALALANDPAMILADEPTGNLDTANALAITRLLLSLSADHGKTVVMVSHDPRVAEQFPTIWEMRDGRFSNSASDARQGATSSECQPTTA